MGKVPYIIYSFYHRLWSYKIPIIPKVLVILNRILFGAYIPASSTIGKKTRFAYGGAAIVIHRNAKVGENCTIGTCVTIGGRYKTYSAPIIGNNVYIATGAKVLGGITIGDNVVIGANAVVIESVESNSVVAGIPAKVIKKNINIKDYMDA